MELKKVTVDDKTFDVRLDRFNDCVDESKPETCFPGTKGHIRGLGISSFTHKYDHEDWVVLVSGLDIEMKDSVELVRKIAKEVYGTDKLAVRTADKSNPYRQV